MDPKHWFQESHCTTKRKAVGEDKQIVLQESQNEGIKRHMRQMPIKDYAYKCRTIKSTRQKLKSETYAIYD